jgi:hypothetical protein
MADEMATPEREAVEVNDVSSASNALEGLLDLGDMPGQPSSDDAKEPVEDATPEMEAAEEEAPVAESDESDAEIEEDQVEEEPDDLYQVTLPGGEKAEVTLDELSKGYSRHTDYTRKTEELAAQRRQMAEEREQALSVVEAERQTYAQRLAQIGQTLGLELSKNQETDWDTLKEEDPIEFATQWADHQRKVEQFRTSQGELQRLQHEENQKVQQNYQVALGEEAKKLSAAMPVFQDEEKAEEIRGSLRTFLKSNYGGFSDQEIGGIADHRHVQLVHDAMKWRNLQSSKTVVDKKVKPLPKVIKSSARKSRGDADADALAAKLKRAKTSGHVNDAAAAIADLI